MLSIGTNLMKGVGEEYSIVNNGSVSTLTIDGATDAHEGEYKCKVATQENVEVTHVVTVGQAAPRQEALEEAENTNGSISQYYQISLTTFTIFIITCRHFV